MKKQISVVMTILVVMMINIFFIAPDNEGNDLITGLLISLALGPAVIYCLYSLAFDLASDDPLWAIPGIFLMTAVFVLGSAGVFETVMMRYQIQSKLLEFSVVIILHGIAIFFGLKEARRRSTEDDQLTFANG